MIFIPLADIDRATHKDYTDFSQRITFGFKLLFALSTCSMILCVTVIPNLALANIPSATFGNFELWRIFTAPLATLEGFLGVMGLVMAFWWLLSLFPEYERKYSTAHLLLEVAFQNFIVQITYSAVALILVRGGAFQETYNDFFYSLGWFPLIIIWVFKYAMECPEERVSFCFLPCLVKNKYLGWICGAFFVILSKQRTALVIATLLGFIQYQCLGRSLIRPPLCLHKALQCLFPTCFSRRASFVTIEQAEDGINEYFSKKNPQHQPILEQQKQIEVQVLGEQSLISKKTSEQQGLNLNQLGD